VPKGLLIDALRTVAAVDATSLLVRRALAERLTNAKHTAAVFVAASLVVPRVLSGRPTSALLMVEGDIATLDRVFTVIYVHLSGSTTYQVSSRLLTTAKLRNVVGYWQMEWM
jgi:hypothetical protein